MLEAAQKSDPKDLRQVGQRIRHREDPEDANLRAYRQFEKRRLRIFDLPDGMVGVEGAVPAPEGMKLRLCLESLVGIPAKGDERTQEQRQADALAELLSLAIGSGRLPKIGGRVPQLIVIVREDGLAELGVAPRKRGPPGARSATELCTGCAARITSSAGSWSAPRG